MKTVEIGGVRATVVKEFTDGSMRLRFGADPDATYLARLVRGLVVLSREGGTECQTS